MVLTSCMFSMRDSCRARLPLPEVMAEKALETRSCSRPLSRAVLRGPAGAGLLPLEPSAARLASVGAGGVKKAVPLLSFTEPPMRGFCRLPATSSLLSTWPTQQGRH